MKILITFFLLVATSVQAEVTITNATGEVEHYLDQPDPLDGIFISQEGPSDIVTVLSGYSYTVVQIPEIDDATGATVMVTKTNWGYRTTLQLISNPDDFPTPLSASGDKAVEAVAFVTKGCVKVKAEDVDNMRFRWCGTKDKTKQPKKVKVKGKDYETDRFLKWASTIYYFAKSQGVNLSKDQVEELVKRHCKD